MQFTTLALAGMLSFGAPASAQPESPAAASTAAKPKPGVQLIGAGAEPLKQLRYSAPVGSVERFELVSKTTQTMSENGKPAGEPLVTTLTYTLTAEVVKSGPEATELTLEIVQIDVESDADTPDNIKSIKQIYATGKGSKASVTVSAGGHVSEIQFKPSPSMHKSAARVTKTGGELLKMVLIPFPEDKVGVGGQWTRSREKAGRAEAAHAPEYTYRLTACAEDRFEIESGLDRSLELQPNPGNLQAKVPEMSGRHTYVRGRLIPVSAEQTMKVDATSKDADSEGESVTRTMTMVSTTSIRRLNEDAARKP